MKVRIGQRFFPLGLTDQVREQIAADVVKDMRQHGQWPELDEEAGTSPNWHGPTSGR